MAMVYTLDKKNGNCTHKQSFSATTELFQFLNDKDAYNSSNPLHFEVIFSEQAGYTEFNRLNPWDSPNIEADFTIA